MSAIGAITKATDTKPIYSKEKDNVIEMDITTTTDPNIIFSKDPILVSTFILLSLCSWVISMLNLIGGKWKLLEYIGLVSVAFVIAPIALKVYRTFRRFQYDSNCMMIFAITCDSDNYQR